MKKVGSKTAAEKQQYETPNDLSIPDFLRRPIPSAAAARALPTKTDAPVRPTGHALP